MKTLQLKKDFYWTGILDPGLRVFDIIMFTEFGTTYNSYVLKGSEKTAVFETSKAKFYDEYSDKLTSITKIEEVDYIIVDHTEPDHAGAVERMLEINPKIKIVGSATAINFMKEITNKDLNTIIVKDGDELSLGDKTLRFLSVPNLHWPDSIYTYIVEDKTLMTCDSFGSHYALDEVLNEKITNQEDYMKALRYYFDCIMGPFKPFMLAAIEKIKGLDIDMICPGHGPVLNKDPQKIVEIYKQWSTEVNPNKKKTIVIPYVAAYGYTETLAKEIAKGAQAAGDMDVRLYDLVVANNEEVMNDLYWADGFLLGTPTIVGEALKPIWDLTTSIFARTHGGKIASAFGSYGWSGEGVPHIMERLKQLNMKVYGKGLRVKFKPSEPQLQEAYEFGYNFGISVMEGRIVDPKENANKTGQVQSFKCLVCGEIIKGTQAPDACPVCGVGPEQFVAVEEAEVVFKSSSDEKILIIGNGAAGISACEAIRARNTVCQIEVISAESVIGYNRPMLTKGILTELDPINFFIKSLDWYKQNNIKLTLNTKVSKINKDKRSVTLESGIEVLYDKLILATGAGSFKPPIQGANLAGVYTIRTLEDANNVREYMKNVKNVVAIGGGVLGLEAAWEMKKFGVNVTIVDMAPGLMLNQLDATASKLLQQNAEKSGIKVIANAKIEGIFGNGKGTDVTLSDGVTLPAEFVNMIDAIASKLQPENGGVEGIFGNGKVSQVRLEDGTVLPADLVVISAGIKPNAEIAKEAGIEAARWISVNEKMQTSENNIFACGDSAAFDGVSIGIWNQAVEMGKVAGANAVGDDVSYERITPSNSYKGMGTSLFAIGDNGKDQNKKYKSLELLDQGMGTYEKLYFHNDRFCGGILMGDVTKGTKLLEGYEKHSSISKMREEI